MEWRQDSAANIKKKLLLRAGYRCSFPGCATPLTNNLGIPSVEFCHITSLAPGSARYDEKAKADIIYSQENIIVLCPQHHRIVDFDPQLYSAEVLKKFRSDHELSQDTDFPKNSANTTLKPTGGTSVFHQALAIWEASSTVSDEEFWHKLFKKNPQLLAQIVPECLVQIADKAYVGGKGLDNSGGKIIDFIYGKKSTKNVVLVEIKTPATRLIGREYRSNVFAVSDDVVGSTIQVLGYRNELSRNYYAVTHAEGHQIEVFDPQCFVIVGNLAAEGLDASQRASFELFRANSSVVIVTFDELFDKMKSLVEVFS